MWRSKSNRRSDLGRKRQWSPQQKFPLVLRQLPQLLVCPLCNLLVRLTMDDILHPCEKPAWSIECYDPGLGMRHSILNDDGFVSLCEAQGCAFDLSFEVGTFPVQGNWNNTFVSSVAYSMQHTAIFPVVNFVLLCILPMKFGFCLALMTPCR